MIRVEARPASSRIVRASLASAQQVAAVEPDGRHRRLDGGGAADALEGVVGIDQQGRPARKVAGEGGEGRGLVAEGLDPGMGHRADGRDAEPERGLDVARAVEAGEVRRPRRQQAGRRSVPAAGPELDQRTAARDLDDPAGLRGYHRRIGDGGDQVRLDPLRLLRASPRPGPAARPGRRRSPRGRPRRRPGTGAIGAGRTSRGRPRRRPAGPAAPRSARRRTGASGGPRSPVPAPPRRGRNAAAAACRTNSSKVARRPAIPSA